MKSTTLLRRASLWVSTIMMSCFGLTGIVSAQAATITNTGPHSTNTITQSTDNSCRITNNNDVDVDNVNYQKATTGDASSSDNTGAYWSGWSNLNPAAWQANGSSFTDWWNAVDAWMHSHTDSTQWAGSGTNTSWAPADTSWGSWDPALWQANGQSYDNWDGQVVGWMNSNSANWMVTWNGGLGGGNTSAGNVSSGDATNVNNTTTNVTIVNSAPRMMVATPSNPCGFSGGSYTPPTGGMGGGGSTWTPSGSNSHYVAPSARSYGGSGGGYGSYYAPSSRSSYSKPAVKQASAPAVVSAPSVPHTPTPPAGGSGGGSTPSSNTISNTGPYSTNTIDTSSRNTVTVTNTNNVSVNNCNNQTATTGNASSTDNTTGGSTDSGNASNGNGTGTGVGLSN